MNQEGFCVGYTDDGMVFLTADTKAPDGKPMQIHFMWEPDRARMLAKELVEAADICFKQKKARIIQ